MLFLISILSVLLAPTLSQTTEAPIDVPVEPQPDVVSIRSIVEFPEILAAIHTTEEEAVLLDEKVCDITDEDWPKLNPVIVEYIVNAFEVNYDTGSFNYTRLKSFMSQEQFDNFVASECDENYNLEETMDEKISVIGKGYLLRQAECDCELLNREESCNRTELILERAHSKKTKHAKSKSHAKRSHSKKSHSKKSHSKRAHSKNKKSRN